MKEINKSKPYHRKESRLFTRILLATNGSESSAKAEEYALHLAKIEEAVLNVVIVMDDSLCHYARVDTLIPAAAGDEFIEYVISERKSEALSIIKRFSALADNEGIVFDFSIRQGNPVKEILGISSETGTDLLIIGGKRRSGIRGLIFSGTAEKIAAESLCTVMKII